MKIGVVGTGYVGLVTGACLAEAGNQVWCHDTDSHKVERLRAGEIPIYEPGLERIVKRNQTDQRLAFTTDLDDVVNQVEVIFIAVGTPSDEDGSADLRHVLTVACNIGQRLQKPCVVVNKSTVPVGTAEKVRQTIQAELDKRGVAVDFDVASNPEFLKEGAAVQDFMYPDRIIIGADREDTEATLRALYQPFNRTRDKVLVMDTPSAELTKYASNAILATKISFMNEMANLAEALGADIEKVRTGMGADPRIGYHFIYPGVGYGGSCFPKDVRALAHMARQVQQPADLLEAVEAVNNRQKRRLFEKISRHFDGDLKGKTIALWGLTFKPNTDDIREAPSLVLIQQLLDAGARVQAYDPKGNAAVRDYFNHDPRIAFFDDEKAAAEGADALALVTEWKRFWSVDFDALKALMAQPVLFDGRNIWNPHQAREQGFVYYGIGRAQNVNSE
jgi:UDPglucose 6-dehydrogenase